MLVRWGVPAVLLIVLGTLPAFSEDGDPAAEARALREAGKLGKASALLEEALEKAPGDAVLLHELGLTAEAHAQRILKSTKPALGRLALQDAMAWYRKAIAAKPDWADPLKSLGRTAILSRDFPLASECYGKAAALDPKDGDARYQFGYALAYERRFREAVEAFDAAEKILGPQPRILLNRGISYVGLPDVPRAKECLLRLVRTELRANRPNSSHCRSGVFWLYRAFSQGNLWSQAEDAFGALSEEFPDYSAGHWYLAYARYVAGRHGAAIAPLRRVIEITPRYGEAHRILTLCLTADGQLDEAARALRAYAALGVDRSAVLASLMAIADGLARRSEHDAAVALLGSFEDVLPEDPELIERRADLMVLAEKHLDAVKEYRRATEWNPFSNAPEIKAQKVVTLLLRNDALPSEGDFRREIPDMEDETGEEKPLYDFEGSTLFPRASGLVSASREEGLFRIERRRDPGEAANIQLTFIPTLDTRKYVAIRCTVRGIEGETFRLMAKDGFDEFTPRVVRIRHRDVVTFTGMPRQVVEFLLDGFEAFARPEIPFQPDRLRALVFEIGLRGTEDEKPSSEIHVHDVSLVAADGTTKLLTDFTGEIDETKFLPAGAASAFARTLFRAKEFESYRADPNTFVSPAILGDEFDPSFVHSGEGAFRLTLPAGRRGPAWGELTVSKVRAETAGGANGLSFWARGAAGGEKLRVTIVDAHDAVLGIAIPARAPRLELGRTMVEGRYSLTKEWRQYRITRKTHPDVDFEALRRVRFDFGTPEGNAPGTVVFLDDIGVW